jgi:hypothetical protein
MYREGEVKGEAGKRTMDTQRQRTAGQDDTAPSPLVAENLCYNPPPVALLTWRMSACRALRSKCLGLSHAPNRVHKTKLRLVFFCRTYVQSVNIFLRGHEAREQERSASQVRTPVLLRPHTTCWREARTGQSRAGSCHRVSRVRLLHLGI